MMLPVPVLREIIVRTALSPNVGLKLVIVVPILGSVMSQNSA